MDDMLGVLFGIIAGLTIALVYYAIWLRLGGQDLCLQRGRTVTVDGQPMVVISQSVDWVTGKLEVHLMPAEAYGLWTAARKRNGVT